MLRAVVESFGTMRNWRTVFIAVLFAIAVKFFADRLYTKLPVHVDGTHEKSFESVRAAFQKNFQDGWERDGAAFAVYYDGKKVVDLWGGYADTMAARKWKEDTTTVTFSTTKAVAAICIALLVDRGRLSYDDLVTKHWPGFGKHGKGNVTVQMALSHMAGLGYLDIPITEDIASDHNKMRRVLEDEVPKWPPGTRTGYHIYTYGWIVDQIVRHVDEKHRSIGQFLREEIAEPHGIDFHIGLPKEEQYRVARLTVPTMFERLSEVYSDIRVAKYFYALKRLLQDTMLKRAANNPSWLQAVFQITMNNPDYQRMEQAAALGIGNARSLAKLFDLVVRARIIKPETLNRLLKPFVNSTDLIMGDKVAKGHGLLYLPLNRGGVDYVIGHTGHGCQQVHFDPKNKIVIAYVSNGLKTGLYDLCRTFSRLHHSVYDIVENGTLNASKPGN